MTSQAGSEAAGVRVPHGSCRQSLLNPASTSQEPFQIPLEKCPCPVVLSQEQPCGARLGLAAGPGSTQPLAAANVK